MDPDACLDEILELIAEIDNTFEGDQLVALMMELVEKVDALDDWLNAGGFLPRRWSDETTGRA